MKLGTKLFLSYLSLALLTVLLGWIGWRGINILDGYMVEMAGKYYPALSSVGTLEKSFESLRVAQRTLLNARIDSATRQRQYLYLNEAGELGSQAMETFQGLPLSEKERQLWKAFKGLWEPFDAESKKYVELSQTLEKTGITDPDGLRSKVEMFRGDHYRLLSRVSQMLEGGKALEEGDILEPCSFTKWAATFITTNETIAQELVNMKDAHQRLHESAKSIRQDFSLGEKAKGIDGLMKTMFPASEKVSSGFEKIRAEAGKSQEILEQMGNQAQVVLDKQVPCLQALVKIAEETKKVVKLRSEEGLAAASAAQTLSAAAILVGLVLALMLGYGITRSISLPLQKAIDAMKWGSEQVAAAAGEISQTSQSLASGASEQAASLEESSAALEELAGQAGNNSKSARKANDLMTNTQKLMEGNRLVMKETVGTMRDIKVAAGKVAGIIKTIEEIAFQTKLLALNAAVEAARAGEHGKGFAVVAEEVRNLAQRSAAAAKDTADLIGESIQQSTRGAEMVEQVAKGLEDLATNAGAVAELIHTIDEASREQSKGVVQINEAVSQMEAATQQTAAGAEEAAAASEELSSQAQKMLAVVADLVVMVAGEDSPSAHPGGHSEKRRKGS